MSVQTPPRASLNTPYGGTLVDLIVGDDRGAEMRATAKDHASLTLDDRCLCDLELLAVGGFSPLTGFLGRADYERVVAESRLANGKLWPLPITLPVEPGNGVAEGKTLALRDVYGNLLAFLHVEELFPYDKQAEAAGAYGSTDAKHPSVARLARVPGHLAAGTLEVIRTPPHYDFVDLRRTPAELRDHFNDLGWTRIVAFQTRNPLHRAHEELTKRAAQQIGGGLLIHPVVGVTKPGDVDHYTRVRTYKALTQNYYQPDRVVLSLLPLAMRMGGPREALWHAIIRRNYGANHFVVGRDHAGPGKDSTGKPFFGPYEAQELVAQHQDETGVKMVPFQELLYLPDEDRYEEVSKIPAGTKTANISGTQVREEYLAKGRLLPAWFSRPTTAEILGEAYPPRHRQGFCLWFTGLSGAGKSTTAAVLSTLLLEAGRQVTELDGDVVRTHLSKGLGFSREDRDTNILRIGFVASEIVRHGGTVMCAAVSPYRSTRDAVRAMMDDDQFIEIFVDTPLAECERRDVKGMYAKARRGEIKEFTGISDPYEPPLNPEIHLDTLKHTPEENARLIMDELAARGFVRREAPAAANGATAP